jgi:hypothetical protein
MKYAALGTILLSVLIGTPNSASPHYFFAGANSFKIFSYRSVTFSQL